MIKKVKGLVAVIAVFASVLVFAGCGKSTGSDGLPSNMGKEYVCEAVTERSYEPEKTTIMFNHDKNEIEMKSDDVIYDTSDSDKVTYNVVDKNDLDKEISSNAVKYNEKYKENLDGKDIFYLKVKGWYSIDTSFWELGVSKDGKQIEMIPLSDKFYDTEIHADLAD